MLKKAKILKNCTKLRKKSTPPEYQNVFITPDMTPKEQKRSKQLRNQLEEHNKEGRIYQIKNGPIV